MASGDESPDEDGVPAEKDLPHEAAPRIACRFKSTKTSTVEVFGPVWPGFPPKTMI